MVSKQSGQAYTRALIFEMCFFAKAVTHYANQFAKLQQLQQLYANSLVVMAVPSNNFNNMEPGSNEDIVHFVQGAGRDTLYLQPLMVPH